MNLAIPQNIIDAAERYNALPQRESGGIAALNLAAYLGEWLAARISRERALEAMTEAARQRLKRPVCAHIVDNYCAADDPDRICGVTLPCVRHK